MPISPRSAQPRTVVVSLENSSMPSPGLRPLYHIQKVSYLVRRQAEVKFSLSLRSLEGSSGCWMERAAEGEPGGLLGCVLSGLSPGSDPQTH